MTNASMKSAPRHTAAGIAFVYVVILVVCTTSAAAVTLSPHPALVDLHARPARTTALRRQLGEGDGASCSADGDCESKFCRGNCCRRVHASPAISWEYSDCSSCDSDGACTACNAGYSLSELGICIAHDTGAQCTQSSECTSGVCQESLGVCCGTPMFVWEEDAGKWVPFCGLPDSSACNNWENCESLECDGGKCVPASSSIAMIIIVVVCAFLLICGIVTAIVYWRRKKASRAGSPVAHGTTSDTAPEDDDFASYLMLPVAKQASSTDIDAIRRAGHVLCEHRQQSGQAQAAASVGHGTKAGTGTAGAETKPVPSAPPAAADGKAPAPVVCSNPACRTSLPSGTKFCTQCGNDVRIAAATRLCCDTCGRDIVAEGVQFCGDCGGKVVAVVEHTSIAQPSFEAGDWVLADWKGKGEWYPGEVLSVTAGDPQRSYKIRYTDEDVSTEPADRVVQMLPRRSLLYRAPQPPNGVCNDLYMLTHSVGTVRVGFTPSDEHSFIGHTKVPQLQNLVAYVLVKSNNATSSAWKMLGWFTLSFLVAFIGAFVMFFATLLVMLGNVGVDDDPDTAPLPPTVYIAIGLIFVGIIVITCCRAPVLRCLYARVAGKMQALSDRANAKLGAGSKVTFKVSTQTASMLEQYTRRRGDIHGMGPMDVEVRSSIEVPCIEVVRSDPMPSPDELFGGADDE